MSFLAKLTIDGEEMVVLKSKCKIFRETDENDHPITDPKGGRIKILLEANRDISFYNWSISRNETKSGAIIYHRIDGLSKMRELKFEGAFCIKYEEIFNSYNEKPMRIKMTISAKKILINESKFSKNWPQLN